MRLTKEEERIAKKAEADFIAGRFYKNPPKPEKHQAVNCKPRREVLEADASLEFGDMRYAQGGKS